MLPYIDSDIENDEVDNDEASMVSDSEIYMEETTYVSRTYLLDRKTGIRSSYIDELDAVVQSVYKMLNTERFESVVHSWDYGIELLDLVGEDFDYINEQLESRIEECLLQDERIIEVSDFDIKQNKENIVANFVITTIFGEVEITKEVM